VIDISDRGSAPISLEPPPRAWTLVEQDAERVVLGLEVCLDVVRLVEDGLRVLVGHVGPLVGGPAEDVLAEFLDFLQRVARTYPRRELHVVLDNYHTHTYSDIEAWLAKYPRITLHFTPTSGSWLNLVEVFFGIITRQAIRRGSYASVP